MLTDIALGRDALDTDAALAAFLQHAQERGFVRVDEIEALQQEFELDEEALSALHTALEDADVEIEEASEQELAAPELDLTPSTPTTTDSLQLFLNGIGRYKLLTADEEVALAKRIERGDRAAKEHMVNANLRLVVSLAKRYQGHGVPLLDLVQDGVIGLNRAVAKFESRKGVKFFTYATWWIRQACQRAIANQSATIRVPVHVQERRQKLRRARQRLPGGAGPGRAGQGGARRPRRLRGGRTPRRRARRSRLRFRSTRRSARATPSSATCSPTRMRTTRSSWQTPRSSTTHCVPRSGSW